jgi:hypothetical protein
MGSGYILFLFNSNQELFLFFRFILIRTSYLPLGEILRVSFSNMAIRMRFRVMNPFSCHEHKYTCHII